MKTHVLCACSILLSGVMLRAQIYEAERLLADSFDFVTIDEQGAVRINGRRLEEEISLLPFRPMTQGIKLRCFAKRALDCFRAVQDECTRKQCAQAAYFVSEYLYFTDNVPDGIRAAACVCLGRMWRENMMSFVTYGTLLSKVREATKEELRNMAKADGVFYPITRPNYFGIISDSLMMSDFLPVFGSLRLLRSSARVNVTRIKNQLAGKDHGVDVCEMLRAEPKQVNLCFLNARHWFLCGVMLGDKKAQKQLESLYEEWECSFVPDHWKRFCTRYPERQLPDLSTVHEPTKSDAQRLANRQALVARFSKVRTRRDMF